MEDSEQEETEKCVWGPFAVHSSRLVANRRPWCPKNRPPQSDGDDGVHRILRHEVPNELLPRMVNMPITKLRLKLVILAILNINRLLICWLVVAEAGRD
jgi:hypothetical protein